MKNLFTRSRFMGLLTAVVLAVSGVSGLLVSTPAFASTSSGSATLTVAPGALGFSSTQSALSVPFTIGGSASPTVFNPPNVTDNTGTGLGWTESVQATNPVEQMPNGSTATPITLSSASVLLTAGNPQGGSGTAPTDNAAFNAMTAYVPINVSSPVTLMSAGSNAGMGGPWYQFANLEITVPPTVVSTGPNAGYSAGQNVPYSVTLTYTLTQG